MDNMNITILCDIDLKNVKNIFNHRDLLKKLVECGDVYLFSTSGLVCKVYQINHLSNNGGMINLMQFI